MDRRVASYLDHARRVLAAGRASEAEGLERQAQLAAESVFDGKEERAAVLALRSDRLVAQGDYSGALTATVQARALVTAADPAFALRMDEARLRLLLGQDGARALIEQIVADGVAGGRANWPMARAYGLLGRACERDGDGKAAREARARGRRLLAATPNPPRVLVEALAEPGPPGPRPAVTRAPSPGPRPVRGMAAGGQVGAPDGSRAVGDPRDPRGPAGPATGRRRDLRDVGSAGSVGGSATSGASAGAGRGGAAGTAGGAGTGRGEAGAAGGAGTPGPGAGGGRGASGDAAGTPGSAGPADAPAASLVVDEEAFAAVMVDLDALVGLGGVKREVHRTGQLLRMRAMRQTAGLKVADVSLHLVFCGGPGTGKTTVARLYGRLYKALGLLATDNLVEVDRSGLVTGYVGQTATRVNEVVDSALEGVLFVDEAYALAGGGKNDFGGEAIASLLKRMEDDRHRLAVICAGYTTEMEAFLASNSGLASRFAETIEFDDYGPVELLAILDRFCGDSDYELDPDARIRAAAVLEAWHLARDASFANARAVRNLFDDLIAAQAERLLSPGGGPPDAAAMRLLTVADVEVAAR